MKRFLIGVIIAMMFVLPVLAWAVGEVVETFEWVAGQNVKKVTYTWTGDASSGAVPATVVAPLNGFLLRAVTRPHVNSTIQPQNLYDLTLTEHTNGSLDLLNGMGMNRSSSDPQQFMPSHNNGSVNIYPVYSAVPLTLTHTNSSIASATGALDLYIQVPK